MTPSPPLLPALPGSYAFALKGKVENEWPYRFELVSIAPNDHVHRTHPVRFVSVKSNFHPLLSGGGKPTHCWSLLGMGNRKWVRPEFLAQPLYFKSRQCLVGESSYFLPLGGFASRHDQQLISIRCVISSGAAANRLGAVVTAVHFLLAHCLWQTLTLTAHGPDRKVPRLRMRNEAHGPTGAIKRQNFTINHFQLFKVQPFSRTVPRRRLFLFRDIFHQAIGYG